MTLPCAHYPRLNCQNIYMTSTSGRNHLAVTLKPNLDSTGRNDPMHTIKIQSKAAAAKCHQLEYRDLSLSCLQKIAKLFQLFYIQILFSYFLLPTFSCNLPPQSDTHIRVPEQQPCELVLLLFGCQCATTAQQITNLQQKKKLQQAIISIQVSQLQLNE